MELDLEEAEPVAEEAEDQEVYEGSEEVEDAEQIEEELQESETEAEEAIAEPEAVEEVIPEEISAEDTAEAAYQEQAVYEENQTEAEPEAEEVHEEKHSPFSKITKLITPKKEKKSSGWPQDFQPIKHREDIDEDLVNGDVNPYTGHEYQTNSVRMHPRRIGYVQVYDRKDHKWTDMTEWAFLGVEERKKATMGKDYEPPIYLD